MKEQIEKQAIEEMANSGIADCVIKTSIECLTTFQDLNSALNAERR